MTPARYVSLWVAIVFPSIAIVEKYVGWPGVVAYVAAAGLALPLANRLRHVIPRRLVITLACATWIVVTILFLVVYPVVNTHDGYSGSDDDDAHNLGATALLAGESPYSQTTYLGNQLHQLPGAYVLAAPFVIAGTSALQNLFWLPLFFLTIARETRDPRAALALAWLVLGLSPVVMHQVVTGGSYPSNAISVLLCLWWLVNSGKWVAAVLWGVALASRANFAFLIPLAFGWLYQRFGWKVAAQLMGLTVVVFLGLLVPFYWRHGESFGPLAGYGRLSQFDEMVPYLGAVLVAMTGVLSVGLAATRMDAAGLLRNCALVIAFPIVAATLLESARTGAFDTSFLPYGVFFSWFMLPAWVVNQGPVRETLAFTEPR